MSPKEEGALAWAEGKKLTDNPYSHSGDAWAQWHAGWMESADAEVVWRIQHGPLDKR